MAAAEGDTAHFLVKGVATSGPILKRVGARVRVEQPGGSTTWVNVRELLSEEDAAKQKKWLEDSSSLTEGKSASPRRGWFGRRTKSGAVAGASTGAVAGTVSPSPPAPVDVSDTTQPPPLTSTSPAPEAESHLTSFLRSKGVTLYADHKDFDSMPTAKVEEILTTFADAARIDVTTTRSFPHKWTFSSPEQVQIEWTGPELGHAAGELPQTTEQMAESQAREARNAEQAAQQRAAKAMAEDWARRAREGGSCFTPGRTLTPWGATCVVDAMQSLGYEVSFSSQWDGRSVYRWSSEQSSILTEFESVHGGPRIGEPGYDWKLMSVQDFCAQVVADHAEHHNTFYAKTRSWFGDQLEHQQEAHGISSAGDPSRRKFWRPRAKVLTRLGERGIAGTVIEDEVDRLLSENGGHVGKTVGHVVKFAALMERLGVDYPGINEDVIADALRATDVHAGRATAAIEALLDEDAKASMLAATVKGGAAGSSNAGR